MHERHRLRYLLGKFPVDVRQNGCLRHIEAGALPLVPGLQGDEIKRAVRSRDASQKTETVNAINV